MSVFVHCKARWEAPVPTSCKNVLLKQRQVANKVNFLLVMCLKNAIFVSKCLKDMCLVRNGTNSYLGDDWPKKLFMDSRLPPVSESASAVVRTDTGNEQAVGGLGSY